MNGVPMKEVIIEFQDRSGSWKQIAIVGGSDTVIAMQMDAYHNAMKARIRARDLRSRN